MLKQFFALKTLSDVSDEEPFGKKKLHFLNEMLSKKKLLSGPVFNDHHLHGEQKLFPEFLHVERHYFSNLLSSVAAKSSSLSQFFISKPMGSESTRALFLF
jgi:hypothetical protein